MGYDLTMQDETALDAHYAFGDNWAAFAENLVPTQIERAVEELSRLVPGETIRGRSFLDIGCGSGLSSLAAIRLGTSKVYAIDLDPISVATTRSVLQRFAPDSNWSAEIRSAMDLSDIGMFDIVYSWGVLHHTGAMWQAIDSALSKVGPGGLFIIALYRKTPCCLMWRSIKRVYSKAGPAVRVPIRAGYKLAFQLGLLATGRSPAAYARDYFKHRGMTWDIDIEDWLGGYPYESVDPDEIKAHCARHGFSVAKSFERAPRLFGLLGTGCDEWVFRRTA